MGKQLGSKRTDDKCRQVCTVLTENEERSYKRSPSVNLSTSLLGMKEALFNSTPRWGGSGPFHAIFSYVISTMYKIVFVSILTDREVAQPEFESRSD